MDLLTPELGLFFWTLIAFLALFFILRKFAWGPILSSLGDREKSIADSIATAERVKGEMTQLKSENEKLMAQAREERTLMLKEAKEMKDRIINEAKEQAKAEAERIGDIFKDMVEIAETYESLNQEEALSEFIQQTELNYWVDYPVVSIKGLPLDENLYSNYFNSFEEEE